MKELKNLNKNILGLIKAAKERDLDIALHRLSAFSSEFKYIKKRNVIQIKLELPADEVTTSQGCVRDILKTDVTEKSKLPLIPLLAVFGNEKHANDQGEKT